MVSIINLRLDSSRKREGVLHQRPESKKKNKRRTKNKKKKKNRGRPTKIKRIKLGRVDEGTYPRTLSLAKNLKRLQKRSGNLFHYDGERLPMEPCV